jgi:hypothetical protein
MHWNVKHITLQEHLVLEVTFVDGMTGRVRFLPSHLTGVFEPLKNLEFFNQVFLEDGIVTWPNAIDLALDAMYDAIKKDGQWILN